MELINAIIEGLLVPAEVTLVRSDAGGKLATRPHNHLGRPETNAHGAASRRRGAVARRSQGSEHPRLRVVPDSGEQAPRGRTWYRTGGRRVGPVWLRRIHPEALFYDEVDTVARGISYKGVFVDRSA